MAPRPGAPRARRLSAGRLPRPDKTSPAAVDQEIAFGLTRPQELHELLTLPVSLGLRIHRRHPGPAWPRTNAAQATTDGPRRPPNTAASSDGRGAPASRQSAEAKLGTLDRSTAAIIWYDDPDDSHHLICTRVRRTGMPTAPDRGHLARPPRWVWVSDAAASTPARSAGARPHHMPASRSGPPHEESTGFGAATATLAAQRMLAGFVPTAPGFLRRHPQSRYSPKTRTAQPISSCAPQGPRIGQPSATHHRIDHHQRTMQRLPRRACIHPPQRLLRRLETAQRLLPDPRPRSSRSPWPSAPSMARQSSQRRETPSKDY